MQMELYPVKVPTSTACRAPIAATSRLRNVPWSAPICMIAWER